MKEIGKETLLSLKAGDKAAFDLIYWKYCARLYNFIHSILFDKSLAEDLTQTCFLRIWECRSNIDPEKSFRSYIYTIARNMVYKETEHTLRNMQLAPAVERSMRKSESEFEDNLDAAFVESYINDIIDRLPAGRREIFNLSRKSGLSNREIAERLNISERTVETQIYRSLLFLKEKLPVSLFVAMALLYVFDL